MTSAKGNSITLKILRREDLADKVCVVVGTRPGIIKMSPLIRELERHQTDHFVIHTGQHYSYEMDKQIFLDLQLSQPRYLLETVKSCHLHGEQTAEMIVGVERALLEEKPKVILVCGDANTNLSAALAARKLNITIGHVESGLRSHDWRMPEEHNRVMIDHISEYLFAPTEEARQNLVADNVMGKIIVTGNTIVDAVNANLYIAKEKSRILSELGVTTNGYFVVTVHREENVDYEENLRTVILTLEEVASTFKKDILFPIHPRTKKRLQEFGLYDAIQLVKEIRILHSLGYLDFLVLLANAALVLTDSGGIQEESCILHVPCVTLRETTERPETVDVKANIIAGLKPEIVLNSVEIMLNRERTWPNPYGDGKAAQRIIETVCKKFETRTPTLS